MAVLLQCTALPPGRRWQCNSCYALPHCLGAVGNGTPVMHCHTAQGQWAVELLQCTALPPGAVGSATPATHCPTAWGQWAVERLLCTATLLRGSGPWNSCNALPYCLGAVGHGTRAIHCLTARGQWAVQFLQCPATPLWGGGQWISCNASAHQLGGWGVLPKRWSLPKERISCNALPHRLGAVGSGTPAMHCLTTWGQWAVELLQCAGPPARGTGGPTREAVAA